jgi:2-oxoisovalerate dehydrogenase E2 component (dihydrolipoyl transacylase)
MVRETRHQCLRSKYNRFFISLVKFDDLVEVFTDKLVAKIPSTCTGTVKSVKFEVDDVCLVGHSLLEIETEGGESIQQTVEAPKEEVKKHESKPAAEAHHSNPIVHGPGKYSHFIEFLDSKSLSTPAVRHFVKKNGLDINQITGTGKGGRVTKEDAILFMEGGSKTPAPMAEKTVVFGQSQDHVKKIVGIQKAMTKTMTDSLTIPTFTFSDDMDATKLINLRQELKQSIDGLTFMPFFIKAISLAMNEHPIVNSVVDQETDADGYIKQYTIKGDHNFSIAIDSKDGLTTPNIKHVNRKSILDLNGDLKDLVQKVQTN